MPTRGMSGLPPFPPVSSLVLFPDRRDGVVKAGGAARSLTRAHPGVASRHTARAGNLLVPPLHVSPPWDPVFQHVFRR